MPEVSLLTKAYLNGGKRLVDLIGAGLALIVSAPLLLVIAIIVRLSMGAPVFFRQQRAGLRGESFTIVKFRTMTTSCEACGGLLPDAQRLTRFGRVLRSTSLDELPEFINVLRGEMSLVGPRPLFSKYLGRYTPDQMRRHEVKPGITGWAQVNGRNALTWEQKFGLDVWYVDHLSPWIDLKTIALTILKAIKREGISEAGQATAQEFMGSPNKTV